MSNLTAARPVLEQLMSLYPGKRIYESDLRLEFLLGSTNQYTLTVLAPDGGSQLLVTPNEIRLNKSDSFVGVQIGFGIYKAGTSTTPTQAQQVQTILSTFPNPNIFTGTGEAMALEALYTNGSIKFLVDDDVYMQNYTGLRFRRSPQSQQGVGSTATNNLPIARDEYDLNSTPFIPLNRPLTMNGNSKFDLTYNMNVAVNMAGTNSANYGVIMFRGYLAVGVNSTQAGKNFGHGKKGAIRRR